MRVSERDVRGSYVSSEPTPVVFVVDDDISMREALKPVILRAGWRAEIFATAREFLSRPRKAVPSCMVLDVRLPDLNGLDLQGRLASDRFISIIFITGHGDVPTTVKAMKAGALEFLEKPFSNEILLNAIQHAIARSKAALHQESELRALQEDYATLTPRERQIMVSVLGGQLNKQVAAHLGISLVTVKLHRRNVMRKMKARSFGDLLKKSARLGIVPAPRK